MNKIISLILILICSIAFLVGGDTDDKSDVDTNKDNRYYIAGINNPDKFEEMFNKVKKLVSEDDKEKVSEYILYPLRVNNDKSTREIKTPEEFIKNYDNIFTEEVKEAFLKQDVKDTFVNYQGVMVGNGEIWFGSSQDLSKYGIIAINN